MANIQRNFIRGRMNKSLDERLIPNGEYVDALNVRLGSTEDSEIGSVENSKGNTKVTSLQFNGIPLSASAKCIGAYEDGSNDVVYWFVHDSSFVDGDTGKLDLVVSFNTKTNTTTYHIISIDDGLGVNTTLNFNSSYLITGVDRVGDLLFFTDNYNPPRFINIKRNYPNPINITPAPLPPSPPTPTPVITNGWIFTSGLTNVGGVNFFGLHVGTLAGCTTSIPPIGVGVSPTTTQIALPGTDCYQAAFFAVTKGYGIQGIGNVSTLALAQFSLDTSANSGAGKYSIGLINVSGVGTPGTGSLSGTITGSDGTSGTWSASYSDSGLTVYTDGNGDIQQPESVGEITINGLTLINNVTYTINT
jgi:hypothetical protein|tara:strand:- start:5014 stop:6096 length:1083 start_codon:yes stop_codon:yes gene_type:complete